MTFRLLWIWAALCAFLFVSPARADAPFTLPDTSGVLHRPLEVGTNRAVVLLFVADDCPVCNAYAPEIGRIYARYAPQNVQFYLVNTDTGASPDAVRRHAAQFHAPCLVLLDGGRALAKRLGASVTPQAFVLSPAGTVLYQGRIDDKYVDLGKSRYQASRHDLREALDAVLSGKPVPHPQTHAVGCFL